MKIEFSSKPTRRAKDGQLGARASVRCGGRHPKSYAFDTHGMTSGQVVAEAQRLSDYHEAKMAKLASFTAVRGTELNANGAVFRVVDCTIFDAGLTLYLDVRKDGSTTPVAGFPIMVKCRVIDAIPSNAEILKIIRAALPDDTSAKQAHDAFVRKVADKMKGR